MKKFLRGFACCGSTNQTNTSAISRARDIMGSPNQNQPSNFSKDCKVMSDKDLDRQIEIERQKKLVKIDSKYCSDNLTCADFRPESGDQLKYNCPICFRFFDQILVTTCCKNYLCHFCIEEMNEKIMKDKMQDSPRCPFCNDENIGLHDVDPKERPKRYTDSPAGTILSSKFKGSFQQTETRQSRFHTHTKGAATKQIQSEVMKLDFDNHKMDVSKAESENPLDYSSLHEEIENIIMRKCPSEPLPKEAEANMLATKLNLSGTENGRQDLRPPAAAVINNKKTTLRHSIIIEEVEVEASPQRPNNIHCKKSYPGMVSEF